MSELVDMHGDYAPFSAGEQVNKFGAGYTGPGEVMSCFLGKDKHWKIVVGHQISQGNGWFYHIYGKAQLK